jgi:hypothetical protein
MWRAPPLGKTPDPRQPRSIPPSSRQIPLHLAPKLHPTTTRCHVQAAATAPRRGEEESTVTAAGREEKTRRRHGGDWGGAGESRGSGAVGVHGTRAPASQSTPNGLRDDGGGVLGGDGLVSAAGAWALGLEAEWAASSAMDRCMSFSAAGATPGCEVGRGGQRRSPQSGGEVGRGGRRRSPRSGGEVGWGGQRWSPRRRCPQGGGARGKDGELRGARHGGEQASWPADPPLPTHDAGTGAVEAVCVGSPHGDERERERGESIGPAAGGVSLPLGRVWTNPLLFIPKSK